MIQASHPGQLMDWVTVTPPYAQNYSATAGNEIGYIKDAFGWVYLKGFPYAPPGSGNGAVGTVYTLPVGYRPSTQLLFLTKVSSISGMVRLDVTTGGVISINQTPGPYAFPLNGIHFQAA